MQSGPSRPLGGRLREQTFGRVIQKARKERGFSQEQLGFESGYHRTYISFLERGLKSPSLFTIMDLADTLQIPASELIKRVERVLARQRRTSTR
jgi:transcriptional regulator with XRE-family HTH domain